MLRDISYVALHMSARTTCIRMLFAPDPVLNKPFRLTVWLKRSLKTNPNHSQQNKMLYDIVDWMFVFILFWFTESDTIEAVTSDVYFYNKLKEKREFLIFDKSTNLATFTIFFFLKIIEDL